MNFKKDILLIDTEFTGLDAGKHDLIQLAAVLLDKKTLKEKQAFNTYIKPLNWKNRDPESMAVNKISWEQLKDAPTLKQALQKFGKIFDLKNVILAYYVGINDILFLSTAYKKTKLNYPFDYHTFNIWGLFYAYLANKNRLTSKKDFAGFGLESLVKMLKIKVDKNQLHDALVDCRLEAKILRKIVSQLK